VLGSVPRPRVGTASGTLAQMRVNGQALGTALSGAIVATRLPVHLAELGGGAPTAAVRSAALAGAIHDAFVVAALVCCLGIVASLVRGSSRPGHANLVGAGVGVESEPVGVETSGSDSTSRSRNACAVTNRSFCPSRRASAANVPLAVAFSSFRPVVEMTLDAIGLRDAFKVVVSGEDVRTGKPAPDIYLLAADRLGVEPDRCVAVEDSPHGVRAATVAGMACLGVATSYASADQLRATRTVQSLAEVTPAALAALAA